ncbi:MAG: DUF5818 domain-containing protein [Terracidiphilus sp.]|nr:DUF5818 domain-containing protein [Terracidiphilus sp.]MDR3776975.1 DUF5818 domain-containing protein [Terracidiphilus sp.]
MQTIKRDLSFGAALSALVFTCALAWGSPFVVTGAGTMPAHVQDTPQQEQNKSAIFTGTVVKDGELYVLRDFSGQVYKLDDPERAKPFEGKSVKVKGQLDAEAKLIHVEEIESSAA